jgi:hypothetical protein
VRERTIVQHLLRFDCAAKLMMIITTGIRSGPLFLSFMELFYVNDVWICLMHHFALVQHGSSALEDCSKF